MVPEIFKKEEQGGHNVPPPRFNRVKRPYTKRKGGKKVWNEVANTVHACEKVRPYSTVIYKSNLIQFGCIYCL